PFLASREVGIFIRSAIFLRFDERFLSIANFFFHPALPLRIGFLNGFFLWSELYRRTGRDVNSRFWLMRNPLLCWAARPESGREVRERFLVASLTRIQSERRRRLALASGFRLLRSFGLDRRRSQM